MAASTPALALACVLAETQSGFRAGQPVGEAQWEDHGVDLLLFKTRCGADSVSLWLRATSSAFQAPLSRGGLMHCEVRLSFGGFLVPLKHRRVQYIV